MKEVFEHTNFRTETHQLIDKCEEILETYRAQGFDLTVRQVYYQLVARNLVPNNQRSYKRVASTISKARRAGLLDWSMIVDRGRQTLFPNHWTSAPSILNAAASGFLIDKWKDQPHHIEVMVEKQALEGILEPVCNRLQIRFTANKGYSSDSMMYRIGGRLQDQISDGKDVTILYLGDHDPSGMDMDRDIETRLGLFSDNPIEVIRLALLMDQIEDMDLPENPAKLSDSRARWYILRHGDASWELDAMPPDRLAQVVEDQVLGLRDADLWEAAVEREDEIKGTLQDYADQCEEEYSDDESD